MEKFGYKKEGRGANAIAISPVNVLTRSKSGLARPAAAPSSDAMAIEATATAALIKSPVSTSEPNVSSPLKRKKTAEEQSADQNPDKKYRIETTEKLLDLMECPVCLEIPRCAPIFSCRNGHLICGQCQPKLECCPICRSPDVGIRNGFAEKFVSILEKFLEGFILISYWHFYLSLVYPRIVEFFRLTTVWR